MKAVKNTGAIAACRQCASFPVRLHFSRHSENFPRSTDRLFGAED